MREEIDLTDRVCYIVLTNSFMTLPVKCDSFSPIASASGLEPYTGTS